MNQKNVLRNIFSHYKKFKDLPSSLPQIELDRFKRMIYDNIRKLDLSNLDFKTITDLIEVLEVFRNKAAQMLSPQDQEVYQDQIIKSAEEQITRLEKNVRVELEERERLRKLKFDEKKLNWQKWGIISAVVFSFLSLVATIISIIIIVI